MYFESEQDHEDFKQIVAIKKWQGRKATVHQLFIDYLRSTKGDPRRKSHIDRRNFSRTKSIDKQISDRMAPELCSGNDQMESLEIRDDRSGLYKPAFGNFTRFSKQLSKLDQGILKLKYVWGFNEVEIGDIYNVSESRICQELKRIQIRLFKRVEKEKQSIRRKSEREPEKISFKKGERVESLESFKMESFKPR